MVNVVDDIVQALVELAAENLTGVIRTVRAVQADLGREHRSRARGADGILLDQARLGIEA